ncbi:SusC/RagA family TonB-linked outer membrane protein [Echinicola vietnamensis]|uniref:TonB-linked outer membrane protein, SusC/RagA family n=1 Tax=Echinicola vietnamensis (strain DSM 17526 / LMG 23754 / KMM 6221) TaxID=926556 RepID=L0FY55_ECHVK|nr:TonB-dependent receptor [Echinicola vietnamensis]AGA77560.1 TonB-linked outer membrane protein, SusC/RagA family [Echinicola vietnamensis DSM 17526]
MNKTIHQFRCLCGIWLLGLLLHSSAANAANIQDHSFPDMLAMHSQGKDLNMTLSVNYDQATAKEVFEHIETQTGFRFVYDRQAVDLADHFTIQEQDIRLYDLLIKISQSSPLRFKQVDNQINVRIEENPSSQDEKMVDITLTGKVTDSEGEPLPGASIMVDGTQNGTVTDLNGQYSIEVPEGATLTVSYIGFQTKRVDVGNQTTLNIVLESDLAGLDEVVVVGYGEIKKKDLTGAVSSIGSREINSVGATNPMKALQANAAGVNITQRTGSVGSGFDIQIRGANSLTGGNPLYVVDGVMTDNIDFLNPNDIERIDILKDASSTAIYGSRGSNGVVIVTTRSGEGLTNQKPTFSYAGFVGVRTFTNMPDFLNTYDESIQWNIDRQATRDLVQGVPIVNSPTYSFPEVITEDGTNYWEEALANGRGTDWLGEFLKPSIQQNHFISAAGASDKVSYVVGFGYQGDDGNVEGQWYKKYNFKASVDARPNDMFAIGANINLAFSNRELISRQGYTRQLFRMPTYAPAFDADGNVIQSPMIGISGNVNPYAYLESGSKYNEEQFYAITNFYLRFSPTKNLSFKSTFSPNVKFGRTGEYFDRFATRSISVARMWNDNNISYIWDNQVNYHKTFGDHRISYDFIQSAQMNRIENAFAYGRDVPFNSLWYNVQSAPQRDATTAYNKFTLLSFTNRLNYSFKDKFLVTGTIRWDGSSKLSEGNKWASFPSAAVAWRMTEEPFLKGSSVVDNLKLRVSYGYTGNNNIPAYSTQSSLNRQKYYDWDGTTADGFVPSAIANSNLTWERTREWNFGADFGFLKNRISGEVNVYDRMSLNLLMERKLAMPTGWEVMMDNVGSVSNKGVELQVKTVNVETGDFTWETNFIFSKNTNKIVELYGKKEDDVPNRWFIGQPVDVVYAMVFDGVWQRDELPTEDQQAMEGTAKVKDLNGDGNIDIDHDMAVLGSPAPSWIGTFTTSFRYRNWDLAASVYTKQGVYTYSPFHGEFTDFNSKVILDVPYYLRESEVTTPRYSNEYPQPSYMGQYYGEDSEDYGYPGFNKDASFVRIQNITLGYNFAPGALERWGVTSMRIYANALNPFLFTNYEGFDPEWAGADMSGVDATNTSYAIYQLGANIKF